MTAQSEQLNTQGIQNETVERLVAQESVEPTEADVEEMIQKMETSISDEENQILEYADGRVEGAPTSAGIDTEKAESIFTTGGFAERINSVKDKIKTLATETKDKIKSFISNEPEVIHFKDMIPESVPAEEGIPVAEAETEKQPELEVTPAQNVENTEEVAETPEQKEKRELNEYLKQEVFTKFSLTAEDQERVLAETPEGRQEVLRRSFENTRKSLETFYEMKVINGNVDDYAVDKAQKQLTYNILASVLEDGVAEIKPKLLGLGLDVSLVSLGFTPETADRDDLAGKFTEMNNRVRSAIRESVEEKIIRALNENGEYRGITIPTEEQMRDENFMEQRGQQIRQVEYEEIENISNEIGFSKWISQTTTKLNEPFTFTNPDGSWRKIPSIDANQFRIKKSKEEITGMLEEEKNLADRTNFLCVNIEATKFEKVLQQSSFRDIFSLNEDELKEMRLVVGRGDEFYLNQRTVIEQALGVYDSERPTVYGTYASENGYDEKQGGADTYGNIFLKLKPEVQATFCEGDSMSGGNDIAFEKLSKDGISTGGNWAEGAIRRQITPEHVALIKGLNNVDKKIENQLGRGINAFGYLEAHIKGLNIDDIESINIPKSVMDSYRHNVDKGDPRIIISRLQQDPKWKDKINIIE